jgi:hypothetical protein
MDQVKLLAHTNGEYYDTYIACYDLKNHVLEFTKEQLSHAILFQYSHVDNSTSWKVVWQDV